MSTTSNEDYQSTRSCISPMRDNTQSSSMPKEVVVEEKERLASGWPCLVEERAELPHEITW